MVSETVALFVPLLLAVVTALSSFLRECVDWTSVSLKQRPSFPFFLEFLPPLGRFPAIHLSNISLLLIGIVIVKDVTRSDFAAVIGSIVLVIFLLILPILEIDIYGQILDEKDSAWLYPKSYYYHCVSMAFLSLSFFGFVELQVLILNFLLSRGFTIGGTLLWIINRILEVMLLPSLAIGLLCLYLSMVSLSKEIQQVRG